MKNLTIMALSKLRLILTSLLIVYMISPIIFKYSPFIQRSLLFMNHVNTHYNFNLSQPEGLGIKCSRLIRLHHNKYDGEIELGAWHILPESSLPNCITTPDDNRTFIEDKLAFTDLRPIVLYVHGNGGTRAGHHRGQLYRRLAYEHDYHIITFDYAGYGDSTYKTPTADGLTADAKAAYEWLLAQPNVNNNRVIVWGHSLGTAVATRMVSELPDNIKPRRLILEAPFDTLANAVANHPFAQPFTVMPYFEQFFVEPVKQSKELYFDSVDKIIKIKTTPILIIHADDDGILPSKLGKNLYAKAVEVLGGSKVKFILVDAIHGLGHKYLCTHADTMAKVKTFIGETH